VRDPTHTATRLTHDVLQGRRHHRYHAERAARWPVQTTRSQVPRRGSSACAATVAPTVRHPGVATLPWPVNGATLADTTQDPDGMARTGRRRRTAWQIRRRAAPSRATRHRPEPTSQHALRTYVRSPARPSVRHPDGQWPPAQRTPLWHQRHPWHVCDSLGGRHHVIGPCWNAPTQRSSPGRSHTSTHSSPSTTTCASSSPTASRRASKRRASAAALPGWRLLQSGPEPLPWSPLAVQARRPVLGRTGEHDRSGSSSENRAARLRHPTPGRAIQGSRLW
jgi:hypothetical protein